MWNSIVSVPDHCLCFYFVLGIGIVKLLFEMDRNELFGKVATLNWKSSHIYWDATTSYIILALFKRTA